MYREFTKGGTEARSPGQPWRPVNLSAEPGQAPPARGRPDGHAHDTRPVASASPHAGQGGVYRASGKPPRRLQPGVNAGSSLSAAPVERRRLGVREAIEAGLNPDWESLTCASATILKLVALRTGIDCPEAHRVTYCVGVMLDKGMIFASDSRTHAGVDNFAKFCKMTVFERPGDRVIVLLSSGNLAGTQAVISVFKQRCADGDAATNLWAPGRCSTSWSWSRMRRAISSDATPRTSKRTTSASTPRSSSVDKSKVSHHGCSGPMPRATSSRRDRNAIFPDRRNQIRKADHRPSHHATHSLADATKCVLVSFDSTMRSNLSVGMPIDLICYERDSLEVHSGGDSMRGRLFHRAQRRMGRGYAKGVSPIARAAVVRGGRMDTFIISCEHGGNRIPAPYRRLFRDQRALLVSPRLRSRFAGDGQGTRPCLRGAARGFDRQPPAHRSQSLDRTPATVFGGDPRRAAQIRAQIVEQHYRPHRTHVERSSGDCTRGQRVIHSRRTALPRTWTVRCAAPTWVCSTTPVGAERPSCAPAGRRRLQQSLRNSVYAAPTPMAKETG